MKRLLYLLSVIAVSISITSCNKPEESKPSGMTKLTITPASLEFSGWEEVKSVEVEANRAWTAEVSDASWLTLSPDSYPSSGNMTKVNIAVTVTANDSESSRDGYVAFYIDGEEAGFMVVKQKTKSDSDKPVDEDPYPISWMNYQWSAGERIVEGAIFEASCCVFADGLTNAIESETGENIRCDIGYTTGTSEPWEDGWTWKECYFESDWGDNFHFQVKVYDLPVGEYSYTFRAYKDGSVDCKYAGEPAGLYDGEEHLLKRIYVTASTSEDPFDYKDKSVTWANLQWNAGETLRIGDQFEAGCKVLIPGVTDSDVLGYDNKNISVELGISLTEDDPTSKTGWSWYKVSFSGDWGTEYYYQGKTDSIEMEGEYRYVFRIRLCDKPFVYAGTNGLWNGTDNVAGKFTVTK